MGVNKYKYIYKRIYKYFVDTFTVSLNSGCFSTEDKEFSNFRNFSRPFEICSS